VALFTVLGLSRQYGDVRALSHGRDYYGRLCGVSAGVENTPFLFWCRNDAPNTGVPAGIDVLAPSCVATCPITASDQFTIPCLIQEKHRKQLIPGGAFGNQETMQIEVEESVVYTAPYPTSPRGGRFCMPKDGNLRLSVLQDWNALHPFGRMTRMVYAGTLGHVYWIFLIVTVTAILLGYIYLYALKYCSKNLPNIFLVGA
jgi:hypothetical protein